MRIAHLILAHNNPKQLERLIKRLLFQDDVVYIHVDKKSDFESFAYLSQYNHVQFINKRVRVDWGCFNIVEATVNSFTEIMASGQHYDFVNLLSGCDYPLQTPQQIHNYLTQNPGKAFMSYLSIENEWQEALPRFTQYHFTNFHFPGNTRLGMLINSILKPKRKLPNQMVPVGRSQWFTVPAECIEYILQYWRKNPGFVRFMKLTWGADEFVFQTILYNSKYQSWMVNNNLRHMDWSLGGASPKTFTIADKSQLLASNKLYARKFDTNKDIEVLDCIDRKLESNPLTNSI
ncbi:beta-1,6-N-acetylglucosaminyltransferase [Mucilaginibacter robiniae]|uniref:Peptide O-xylosyltransferase n=1 Tax=Mucilaginibacter robiniae TaxID=2728022 RepID=A0A7L5DX46_9SPHI|nr:beta-1,6-N-acetylglucosaminyltransferase [Mucilaginibacter robiniae]QJD94569.1 beta-1,6-N-acetylglucosaminyltransferase [Mucilaginibacter robiniae]